MTTYSLNESENNRTFTNEGATGPVTFILPTGYSTNIGFHCHFAVVVGQTVTIRASDNSTIRIGTLQPHRERDVAVDGRDNA